MGVHIPTSQRMVAVAIAVADAEPLAPLPAALNGARDFAHWARAQGYQTALVTDTDEPVTVERLRITLEAILDTKAAKPIERLVIYFAGHGLIQEAEEGLWLVSDWHAAARCIHVSLLKRRLFTYEIGQVTIFSDACRLLPVGYRTAELTLDGVLGWGPRRWSPGEPTPPVDTFIAAQDYAPAFAVPGPTPEEDRCIFTGVLLPGLWGTEGAAFSTIQKDRVVSRSLGSYLDSEVRRVAGLYKRELVPTIYPMFPEGADVYYVSGSRQVAPPDFPHWPPADKVLPQAPDAGSPPGSGLGPLSDPALPLPPSPRPTKRPDTIADGITSSSAIRFDVGCGFAVAGAEVREVWAPPAVLVEAGRIPGGWQLHAGDAADLHVPVPVLLELDSGHFAAVCALPDFVGHLVCDNSGVSALVYGRGTDLRPSLLPSVSALQRMEGEGLRSSSAIDLAVSMRQRKHDDPVLGVISAYLYDSLGDVDSIRRMAYYYVYHAQPIPYDIALLAQLQGQMRNGVLSADVPAVPERSPRTSAEKEHEWSFGATPSAQGLVGGMWPWLRQGWLFLDDPTDLGSSLIHPALRDMVRHLRPGRFATVDSAAAMTLAGTFSLERRTPPASPPVPAPEGSPVDPSPPVAGVEIVRNEIMRDAGTRYFGETA